MVTSVARTVAPELYCRYLTRSRMNSDNNITRIIYKLDVYVNLHITFFPRLNTSLQKIFNFFGEEVSY